MTADTPPEARDARDARDGRDGRDARALRRAERIADVLDRAWRVPGTGITFGVDAVAGLIPVLGDTATALVGFYPIADAIRLGVRKGIVARMLGNLAFDWLVGLIPFVDIVLDVAFKANVRNAKLLAGALRERSGDS